MRIYSIYLAHISSKSSFEWEKMEWIHVSILQDTKIHLILAKANKWSIKVHFAASFFFFNKVGEECELQRACCLGVHQELRLPCSELILVPVCLALGVDLTSSAANLQLITNVFCKSIALTPSLLYYSIIHPMNSPRVITDGDTSISVAFYQAALLKCSLIKRAADSHTHLLRPSSIFLPACDGSISLDLIHVLLWCMEPSQSFSLSVITI